MSYNIFKRENLRYSRRLIYVCTVTAKDSFAAMTQFCGQPQHRDFVAMNETWRGNSSYQIKGLNYNYACN